MKRVLLIVRLYLYAIAAELGGPVEVKLTVDEADELLSWAYATRRRRLSALLLSSRSHENHCERRQRTCSGSS